MARVKTKESPAASATAPASTAGALAAFDALMATAGVDSTARALHESGADESTLEAALTDALRQAQGRWGLGLHHLRHAARPTADGQDVELLADGRAVARVSEGARAIAAAYAPMTALDERGLSLWGVLEEGHRVPETAPATTLKVLIEDARDFETLWSPLRGGAFGRTWRRGDVLSVEVARPASPEAALSDAAWDVITSIKDRTFQRELMRRSEEVGMLGALLAARHSGAGAALSRLPEAHFTVQAVVHTLSGDEARNVEAWRGRQKQALQELEEHQAGTTRQLSEVLRYGLSAR